MIDEQLITMYNNIYEDGMIWFYLASYISSENFWDITKDTNEEQFNALVKKYEFNIIKMKNLLRVVDSCDKIPEVDQNKIKEYAERGIKLLEDEMEIKKQQYKCR